MRLTRKPSLHPATLWQALPGHYSPHLQTAEQFHPQGHNRTKQSHNPHTLHPAQLHFFYFIFFSGCTKISLCIQCTMTNKVYSILFYTEKPVNSGLCLSMRDVGDY